MRVSNLFDDVSHKIVDVAVLNSYLIIRLPVLW